MLGIADSLGGQRTEGDLITTGVTKALRAFGVTIAVGVSGFAVGVATAQDSEEPGTNDAAVAATLEQIETEKAVADDNADAIVREALEAARAGELKAPVDQQAAARTLEDMLSPPADRDAANALERDAIDLLEQLRAAGDIPPASAAVQAGGAR